MNKSDEINELAVALAKAQAEMSNPKKTANNPFFKSKYSDLAEVINVSKPVLANHGLTIVQTPHHSDGHGVCVATTLLHESGQYITSTMCMMPTKPDPQGIGSCLTYIRRYSWAAVAGLAQEDDDGNAASAPNTTIQKPKPQPKPDEDILNKFRLCESTKEAEDLWVEVKKADIYRKIFGTTYRRLKDMEDENAPV